MLLLAITAAPTNCGRVSVRRVALAF